MNCAKLLRIFALVVSALILSGCSTNPPKQPEARLVIPAIPAHAASPCAFPMLLPINGIGSDELVTDREAWVSAASCEAAKRRALIQAWPK